MYRGADCDHECTMARRSPNAAERHPRAAPAMARRPRGALRVSADAAYHSSGAPRARHRATGTKAQRSITLGTYSMRAPGELLMRFPLVLASVVLAACGSDNPAAPTVACQTAITATVGTGTTPRFDWSPACGITAISVIAAPGLGTPTTMWIIESDTRLLGPGIRYGDTPAGTRTATPAHPVTHGSSYMVSFTGPSGQPPVAILSWTP
jgi:hypothetical protein